MVKQPPTSDAAPCVRDALTLKGLARLRRDNPSGWAQILVDGAREVGRNATVGRCLRGGAEGLLLPRASSEEEARRLKKERHLGRRLQEIYGGVRLAEVDEAWLERERPRLEQGQHPLSASQEVVGAAFTLLRKMADLFQRRHFDRALVQRRQRRCAHKKLGPRPRREELSRAQLDAFWGWASPRLQAAIALQLICHVSPGRVLALELRQVNFGTGEVAFYGHPVRGRPGETRDAVFAFAPATEEIVNRWVRKLSRVGPVKHLFPKRGAASGPTRSINRAIRKLCREAGKPVFTMSDVRRLGQAMAHAAGAPRAMVRGTASTIGGRAWVGQPAAVEALRERRAPLAEGSSPPRLPRRAPNGCPSTEAELTFPQGAPTG